MRWSEIDRAFDSVTRTVDVRSIGDGRGRHDISNVAIFLGGLHAVPLSQLAALRLDDQRYLFDPLGSDTQLFTRYAHDQVGAPGHAQ